MTHAPEQPPAGPRPLARRTARRTVRTIAAAVAVVLVAALLWAIKVGSPKESLPSGVDGLSVPWSAPSPERFVDVVDHEWLALVPGARWEFDVQNDDEARVLEVSEQGRDVAGIETTVVTYDAGAVEDVFTADVAQDVDGNVWLLALTVAGEPEASWSVAKGAAAGLVLPAVPRRGDGHAVAAPDGTATVRLTIEGAAQRPVETPLGSYDDVLAIELATVPQGADDHTQRWNVDLARGVGPIGFASYMDGAAVLVAHTD